MMVRSIGAVLAGFAVVVVLSIGTDALLEATIFPQLAKPHAGAALLLLATAYRCAYTIAGGYVTARLAPGRPAAHAIILGLIGTALAILGAAVMWNLGDHWYPIALVITALPCCWLGAKLFQRTNPATA